MSPVIFDNTDTASLYKIRGVIRSLIAQKGRKKTKFCYTNSFGRKEVYGLPVQILMSLNPMSGKVLIAAK